MRKMILRFFQMLALLTLALQLNGQCTVSGIAIDGAAVGGCGWLLVDEEGNVFEPQNVPISLEDGQQVTFDYVIDMGTTSCFLATPVWLTCLVDQGATGSICQSGFSFDFYGNPPVVLFQPSLSLPGILEYAWSFGDGATSSEATTAHNYAEAGEYEVCLTVSYTGCSQTSCMTIPFYTPSTECNFALSLSFDGEVVSGEIYNMTDYGPYHPDSVTWSDPQTGLVIGYGPYLEYPVSDPGFFGMICAGYSAIMPGGDTCQATICQAVSPAGTCIDLGQIDPGIDCPTVFMPVCGCDGVTYANECEAQYWYGVTSWTPGPCQGDTSACVAFFHVDSLDAATFQFLNTSVGDFSQLSWAVNGFTIGDEDTFTYSFQEEGIHTVCLTIWNDATGCYSAYCDEIYVGDPGNMCQYTDCVWPGDANGDGKANVYDLLYVGVGYGSFGLQRPGAHLGWVGQYAPDWELTTQDGVDYKHLDCNGDGVILADDIEAITQNYQPVFNLNLPVTAGKPLIYLDFDQDSVVIDASSPEYVTITAGLMVGEPANPIDKFHGLALQLYYPQQDLVLQNSAGLEYVYNSFMGSANQVFWEQQDFYNFKRLDVGCSRKGGSEVQGSGRVATVQFIIVSDIIGGRAENVIDFDVFMDGVMVVNGKGELLEIDVPSAPANLKIINNFVTRTDEAPDLNDEVEVFPNPAKGKVYIRSEKADLERISVFNALGQLVLETTLGSGLNDLPMGGMPAGVYLLEIETETGRVSRRLVLE